VIAAHPEGHGVIHLALLLHTDHRKPHAKGYPADHIPVPLPGPYASCHPVPADSDFCAVQLLDILRLYHRAAAKKPAIEQIRKAAVVFKISCRQYIFIPHAFSFPSNAHPGFAFIIQERSCKCNGKSCILYKHTDSCNPVCPSDCFQFLSWNLSAERPFETGDPGCRRSEERRVGKERRCWRG